MENESRKASDILLDLEYKIISLTKMVGALDLNIKILSNKLNSILDKMAKPAVVAPKITVEAVNSLPNKNIDVSPDSNLQVENSPKGFRRNSRSAYEGDDAFLPPKNPNIKENNNATLPKLPAQIPVMPTKPANKEPGTDFFPAPIVANKNESEKISLNLKDSSDRIVPVMQRIVNNTGKSVFMADVEIVSLDTGKIEKTRTGATGKWSAALKVGNYKVNIKKNESLTKEKIEISQNISVDGKEPRLELQTMIIK